MLATRIVVMTVFTTAAAYFVTHTVDECDNRANWGTRATVLCWIANG